MRIQEPRTGTGAGPVVVLRMRPKLFELDRRYGGLPRVGTVPEGAIAKLRLMLPRGAESGSHHLTDDRTLGLEFDHDHSVHLEGWYPQLEAIGQSVRKIQARK